MQIQRKQITVKDARIIGLCVLLFALSCGKEPTKPIEHQPVIDLPSEVPRSTSDVEVPINVPVLLQGNSADSVHVSFRKASEETPYSQTMLYPAGQDSLTLEHLFSDTTQPVEIRAELYEQGRVGHDISLETRPRPFTVDITSSPDSGLVPLTVGTRIQFQPRPFFRTVRFYPEGLQGPVTTFQVPNSNQPYDSVVQRTYTRAGTFNPTVRIDFHTSNRPIEDRDTVRVLEFGQLLASMNPTNGPAYLETLLNLRTDGQLANQARVRWGDGQDTLIALSNGFQQRNIPHTYGLGEFLATVGFFLGPDSVGGAQIPVSSYNEPPYLLIPLPDMTGVEGDSTSFPQIPLMAYTWDRFTQNNDSLLYTIQSQTGPAVARIDENNTLRITQMNPGDGPGGIVVRITDPQGLYSDNNVNTNTQNRPTMHVFLTDYNGNPLSEGIALYNGTQTPFSGSAFVSGVPGNAIISAWQTGPQSFQGTRRLILGENDVDVTIPVINYSALEGICTPEEYLQLMNEARNVPRLGPPPEYELLSIIPKMRLDSAALGFQNGGVTIWIEKHPIPVEGLPQDSITDAEQDYIEQILLERHHPKFPSISRAQIYKARADDPTYFEYGVGPTTNNIITIHKATGQSPGFAVYDDNGDGIIDRASVALTAETLLNNPYAILQEVLGSELAPGRLTNPAWNGRSMLHDIHGPPTPYLTIADSLIIDMALKIPYSARFDDWFTQR